MRGKRLLDRYGIEIFLEPKTNGTRSKMDREHDAEHHRGSRMTRLYPRLTNPVCGLAPVRKQSGEEENLLTKRRSLHENMKGSYVH